MADEPEEIGEKTFGPDALAARLALDGVSPEEAREYLRRQNEIAKLQIENLRKQDEYETSHLRWRRFNDQMRGALQIMGVLVAFVVVVAIGAALWSASQADGLVIEAPSVPPSLANQGITGIVVAAKLLDRLTALQDATDSARVPSSFRNNWTNDIKVEIPDTGISFGQLIAWLDEILGHERHLTGELIEVPTGLALTVRLSNTAGETFTGPRSDLDGLIGKAAESIYARAQPYRYARYIQSRENRLAESMDILRRLSRSRDPVERIWAISGIALGMSIIGDFPHAYDALRRGRVFDPESIMIDRAAVQIDRLQGHDEAELADSRLGALHARSGDTASFKPELVPTLRVENDEAVAADLGDLQEAAALDLLLTRMPDYQGSADGGVFALIQDFARLHDIVAARETLLSLPPDFGGNQDFTLGVLALEQKDWRSAFDHMTRSEAKFNVEWSGYYGADTRFEHNTSTGPWMAYAAAKLGNDLEAERVLRGLPADCVLCVRVHALVAAAEDRFGAASWWFARADRMASSLPFAVTDWGEMLLGRGDFDGAIAKFAGAHKRGPHFADPLEMWGEALIQKNRSDLARAKFEEADKYAPHWGRLHLEWGKALLWSGNWQEAQKQFALASSLDLSAADRADLARLFHG